MSSPRSNRERSPHTIWVSNNTGVGFNGWLIMVPTHHDDGVRCMGKNSLKEIIRNTKYEIGERGWGGGNNILGNDWVFFNDVGCAHWQRMDTRPPTMQQMPVRIPLGKPALNDVAVADQSFPSIPHKCCKIPY